MKGIIIAINKNFFNQILIQDGGSSASSSNNLTFLESS
jgi:hypothetical protein